MSIFKLSLVGIGSRLALMGVVTTNALLLARLLGPQGFGKYVLFIRLVAVLAALADFGLSQSSNVFFGRHTEWAKHLHHIILRFVPLFWIGTTALGMGILWLAGDTILPYLPWNLILMAFAVLPLSLYANFWNSMMIGMGRIWHVNLVQLVICTLSLLLTVLFVFGLSGDLITAAVIYMALLLVQFISMIVIAFRLKSEGEIEKHPMKLPLQMLHFGLRSYLGSLSYLLWMRIPVFLLNAVHGPVAVGIFSVAQHIAEKTLLPVQAIRDASYQKMSLLANGLATMTMNRYLRLTLWGMSVVVLIGLILAPWGVQLLLGEAYANVAQVYSVLLCGVVFMSASLLLDAYFLNQLRRPGLLSILAWVNVLIGSLLVLLLVPSYGATGAAWALVITQVVGTVIYLVLYLRMTQTSIWQLISISGGDVTRMRKQVSEILGWKEG